MMASKALWAAAAAAALFSIGAAQAAGDAAAGQTRARACNSCHGSGGISDMPGVPSVAGQDEMYIIKALGDFRSGERKDEQMTLVAQPLTDQDIENLAAYYTAAGKAAPLSPAP
jgi:cytochrome c553